ncbi:gametogenetin-binding protein 2-like [Eupeodes corollae]|uniref:gametogenetin-binding protein 2-like n=1 Tax=Eupeodes corollae TaxID=290404 RepID=UPI002490B043|nr:gametogenetin-binding protein 2-like [Eupeodes corollae]
MARLTNVYHAENINSVKIGRRQLPVIAGDNLMMLMDLNSKGLAIDSSHIKGKELEEFTRKFNLLTPDELRESLEIDSSAFLAVLNQCVQCVGCRRSVERLFYQLTLSGHPTLDPIVLKSSVILSIAEEKMKTPQTLGTLLYRHHEVLNNLVESKLRNKTRCVLHSLDAFRSKPFSETWREVWSSMKQRCREELSVIKDTELHEVLENYLKKHKFCQGCRAKIEKAYNILVGETTTKEKGFVAALYANIKKCQPEQHIHVQTKADFIDTLIRRAEPEVNGSYTKQRERHAKTLEIAQEEVLTCVGMIMYERLRRIYVSLREEERACQVLAAVGVHALCRSFDMSVEKKQGISNLELLYNEISREEKAKEHKREQKKLKKKKKKNEKKNSYRTCDNSIVDDSIDLEEEDVDEHEHEEEDEEEMSNLQKEKCIDCSEDINVCPCESDGDVCTKLLDAGYGSDPNANSGTSSTASTPEGSEVSCSDGFCNHDRHNNETDFVIDKFDSSNNHFENDPFGACGREKNLSLLQMLEDFDDMEDEENCYIPNEVVMEYQCHQEKVNQQRQELRETLKQKFAAMCMKKRVQLGVIDINK